MASPQTEMADTNGSLLTASLKHIEDIRSLSVCKICMRSLYEPFILSCGHTYCYSCLASWFGGALRRRSKKNCPDCRARITAEPSPNYILRDLVHMLTGRAELLPEDETLQEHQLAKDVEAAQVAADRTGPGLFKGIFVRPIRGQLRWGQGILDPEDNVLRCPECHWELEDGECPHCGFHEMYDSNGPLESDFDSDSVTDLEVAAIEDPWGFGLRRRHSLNWHHHEISPALSETDEEDDYGEEDDLDDFIDNSLDEDNDDTNSESTMTMYNRQWAENTRHHNARNHDASDAESQASADSGHDHFGRYGDYIHRLRNEVWGPSDAETNYDEMTEASEHETTSPPADLERSRALRAIARRRVVSDDDDDDDDEGEEEEGQEEDGDEEPEDEDEDDDTQHSETEGDQSHSESEESDVRPPQPSSRRRQHLQSQRARRNDSNHQSNMEGAQRRNSPVRQQYRHRQRSNIPRNSASGRRTGYQQPFERPGYNPGMQVGRITGYSL
ncbi:uncharacterized protein Z520_06516 [Fonsecaea multimorphosa CBS 102226]|uniref:RING-type domain-containing protein n=1 Tax=Fonsecaea multimorphosa CBS 102226 TaxID=1442371 RepID=A0A0D2KM24_9EURO|nr:uncharacterized protein Z520_06516 [Fonsecaea multimorphosa CBS 102226]KIX97738.1 hypothetical protein Z520_06516 [Fonsecaea multimorphosa CBS 102226]OAL23901.1 hypothetical protein AYO22_06077 [Fonsecaea multimorphosa]